MGIESVAREQEIKEQNKSIGAGEQDVERKVVWY